MKSKFFEDTKSLGFLAFLSTGLVACGTGTGEVNTVNPTDLPLRDVDWRFCQTWQGETNCTQGTATVWVAPDMDSEPIKPEAFLMPTNSFHTVAIRSYGCFPEYEQPQEFGLYDVNAPVDYEFEGGLRARSQHRMIPVEILEVSPLDEARVQGIHLEGQLPPIAITSNDCPTEQ
ncbi:MAG: hypothetical protein AAF773_00975 [Cyanobacteria bacterium P01_D01_bin.115]